jgi:hypothetical protein
MNWFDLVQDRDQWRVPANTANEPLDSIKYWEILE